MIMTHNKGFTLAELLVTLAIFSILTSMAGVSFGHILQNSRRVSLSNIMIGSIQLARSEAIAQNRRVTICASDDSQTCSNDWSNGWIIFVDTSRDNQVNGAEIIIRSFKNTARINIISTNITNNFIYRPNGRIMINNNIRSLSGQFVVCDARGSNYARTIIIESSGRPRVSKYNFDRSNIVCP